MKDFKVGDTVKAGDYLLFTNGAYSDYGVDGLYRAKCDFVIPGEPGTSWSGQANVRVAQHAISIRPEWVEEIEFYEVWGS